MIFSNLKNLIKGVLLAMLNLPLLFLWFSDVEIVWKICGTIALLAVFFGIGMMVSLFQSDRRSKGCGIDQILQP